MFHNCCILVITLILLVTSIKAHVVNDVPSTTPITPTANQNTVEIFVPNGRLIGEKVNIKDLENRSVVRFLGVPYAKAPVGRLRFRRPEPLTKWSDPVRALSWPPSCFQNVATLDHFINQNMSEDCLKLNLWTPGVNADEHSLRPVLFWISGGDGFHTGSASIDLYNGEALAVLSNSVVVTINYRVSTLGFLYADQVEGIKGNQGLWDQALALRWVSENIRYFGGDPSKVTIMGGWSVSLHILSPVTRNLFSHAILMSGAALGKDSVISSEQTLNRLLTGVRKVGCEAENVTSIREEEITCLQTISPEQVNLMDDGHALVVVDGDFLSASPISMLTSGNHKRNFNLLVSTVQDEQSFYLQFSKKHNLQQNNSTTEQITNLEETKKHLLNLLQSQSFTQTNQHEKLQTKSDLTRLYLNGLNGNTDKADLFQKIVGTAYNDNYLTCPTLEFTKALFRSSPENIKVYQWLYSANLGNGNRPCGRWAEGRCQVDDVYPVFGVPFRHRKQYHNREREISSEVIRFIRAFVLTGSPGEDQKEWQSYFMADGGRQLVAPYYEIDNDHKRHRSFKFNLKQLECGLIWNKFIYTPLPLPFSPGRFNSTRP